MTKSQLDTILQIVQDGGIATLLVVALAFVAVKAINAWRDKKPHTNGNGKAHDITNKRVDAIGEKVSEHSAAIGALTAQYKETRVLIDKNNDRLHERFDELIERLPPLKKGKE